MNCCSYECGEHEEKARERKEELEAQAKDHETVLAQISGTFLTIDKWDSPISRLDYVYVFNCFLSPPTS